MIFKNFYSKVEVPMQYIKCHTNFYDVLICTKFFRCEKPLFNLVVLIFFRANGDGNNNVRPRRRIERTNSRVNGQVEESRKELQPPKIPEIGEYFDVHVTMAANPSNFTVQPHANKAALAVRSLKLLY